jgi:hypothetical protein
MRSLGVKSFTALYLGLSAVAVYLMMHAALAGNTLVPATTSSSSVASQSASGSSTTSTSGSPSGQSSTSSLASQQYDQTTNWAGYATTGNTYTSITASWRVPTASSANETSADATWIGIGGITGNDLIQAGTQNIVAPDGAITTAAFYEMLPDASITVPSIAINAGDEVSAKVDEVSTGEWQITFTDSTNGQSFSTVVDYASSNSSAEWIEEDPSDGNGQQIPLDSFGTVPFTDGTVNENGSTVSIAKSGAQEVSMISEEDQSLASVSGLSTNGEDFTVTRTSAASGAAITQFNNNPNGWVRRGSGIGFGGGYGYRDYRYQEQAYGF